MKQRKPRRDWAIYHARHNFFFRFMAHHPSSGLDLDFAGAVAGVGA
jgi:hypothetical protein